MVGEYSGHETAGGGLRGVMVGEYSGHETAGGGLRGW